MTVGSTGCCPISIQGRGHEREGTAFFGEFDRQVTAGYGKVFGEDVGGKVGRSIKEEVEEFVEQFLGVVHVAGEVFGTGELTNVVADGFYTCHSPWFSHRHKESKKRNGFNFESKCKNSRQSNFKIAHGAFSATGQRRQQGQGR
jgi:hypothetical protein